MYFGSHFWEKMWKRKNVFGLRRRVRIAYEPIPWSAQGDPQIEEKKGRISEPCFLAKKLKKSKKELHKVSKRVKGNWGWRLLGTLGAPLVLQAFFWFQKWAHGAPKVLPGTENYFKNDSQSAKMTLKVPLKVNSLGTLKLNRRFGHLARRTARSALNKIKNGNEVFANIFKREPYFVSPGSSTISPEIYQTVTSSKIA